MKTVAIVQARMGSTRFPNKVMQPICGIPMIGILLERLAKAKRIDQIVLATSKDVRNKPLIQYVRQLGFTIYEGSDDDVLDRYQEAAKEAAKYGQAHIAASSAATGFNSIPDQKDWQWCFWHDL